MSERNGGSYSSDSDPSLKGAFHPEYSRAAGVEGTYVPGISRFTAGFRVYGMEFSPSIKNIGTALARAQSEMLGAVKDSTNPHFKSRYADLSSVWEACRKALTSNEIAVVQGPGRNGREVSVTTTLIHSSGEWISSQVAATPQVQGQQEVNAQQLGSIVTYLRRYALSSMVGVTAEDDDGNAVSVNSQSQGSSERGPDSYWKNRFAEAKTQAQVEKIYTDAKQAKLDKETAAQVWEYASEAKERVANQGSRS